MLSSTKPRSPTPRVSRTPQHPPISYPFSVTPRPSSQATLDSAQSSPPPTSSRSRNTMHWLPRSSSSHSSASPYTPPKPTRISEPKLIRSIELVSQPRSGTLGSGATVVRTPDEALRETGVRLTFDGKPDSVSGPEEQKLRSSITSHPVLAPAPLPSPATSTSELSLASPPFVPSLPKLEVESELLDAPKLPRPTRAPPSAASVSLKPSLKRRPVQQVDDVTTPVPLMPEYLSTVATPPPFRPILVSEVPTGTIDYSKIIVTVETSSASHKTTLETLNSRSSHLSEYLRSLLPSRRTSITSSIYSHTSDDDISAYRHHLTSQGFLSPASSNVHLFLDRSSTPYQHIFNYLRSPLVSPDTPETLPRSIQMLPHHQQLESLLELRDEAAYLGLESLCRLCMDEICLRHGRRPHTRRQSQSTSTTVHSMNASVYSLHALLDSVESDVQSNPRDSRSSGSMNVKDNKDNSLDMTTMRSLPTPQSWNRTSRRRSEGRHDPAHPHAPAGWI